MSDLECREDLVVQELAEAYEQYRKAGKVWFDLPPRTWLKLTGKDRAAFLNNFCTADIAKLKPGTSTELFVLDTRGKILAFGNVFALPEALLISTADRSQSNSIREHLDKYVIREDVEIVDVSNNAIDFFVLGNEPSSLSKQLAGLGENDCVEFSIGSDTFFGANIELAGFGLLIRSVPEQLNQFRQQMSVVGATEGSDDLFELLRIAGGVPAYGVEIDDSNLPQELRRDEKAISFTKGCYLGQETVAKIDAIGHVNRFLVGLVFGENSTSELPGTGDEIFLDGKKIGELKSITFSPQHNRWIGMGYVKRNQADSGNEVRHWRFRGVDP